MEDCANLEARWKLINFRSFQNRIQIVAKNEKKNFSLYSGSPLERPAGLTLIDYNDDTMLPISRDDFRERLSSATLLVIILLVNGRLPISGEPCRWKQSAGSSRRRTSNWMFLIKSLFECLALIGKPHSCELWFWVLKLVGLQIFKLPIWMHQWLPFQMVHLVFFWNGFCWISLLRQF